MERKYRTVDPKKCFHQHNSKVQSGFRLIYPLIPDPGLANGLVVEGTRFASCVQPPVGAPGPPVHLSFSPAACFLC